jgi:hypothetical protein
VIGFNGRATIRNGRFDLYIGTFAGCSDFAATYRIDAAHDGRCDDGVDRVYRVQSSVQVTTDLEVTGDAPGESTDCSAFGSSYDLELAFAGTCLPPCGSVQVGLFETGDSPIAPVDTYFLDALRGPNAEHVIAGVLVPGHDYELRWYLTIVGGCSQAMPTWSQPFEATAGVKRITLSLASEPREGVCFPSGSRRSR